MSLITIPAKDIWKYIRETGVVIIDLRSQEEYQEGHIKGAINVPYDEENEEIEMNLPKKYTFILYCERGNVSLQIGRKLSKQGYHIVSVYGGIHAYRGKLSVDE